MTAIQWIVTVIGTGGFGKFLWDGIAAVTSRSKNKTDNAVVLLNSATGYSARIEARLDSVTEAFDRFRKDQQQMNEENIQRWRRQDQLLMQHSRWDHQVVNKLKASGIPVEEPPPLFLPALTEGTP